MTLATAVWRRFPVRGAGRLVIPALSRAAAGGEVLARGPFGTRIAVESGNPAELSIYLWGTCAPEVEGALARLLEPGASAIDLGAGTGVMTAVTGVCCRPGRVVAVAPSGTVRIARQAELNGVAVEVIESDPVRLDAALEGRADERFALIRIDAGGREGAALRGASRVVSSSRPALIFDWCPDSWSEADTAQALSLLEGLGYELFASRARPSRAWSVAPARFLGYEPVALGEAAAGKLGGGIVVALPSGDPRRDRLLG